MFALVQFKSDRSLEILDVTAVKPIDGKIIKEGIDVFAKWGLPGRE